MLYLYFRLVVRPNRGENGKFYDPWEGGLTLITVLLFLATIVGTAIFLFYGITHLISPEYYAVDELIERFKSTPYTTQQVK